MYSNSSVLLVKELRCQPAVMATFYAHQGIHSVKTFGRAHSATGLVRPVTYLRSFTPAMAHHASNGAADACTCMQWTRQDEQLCPFNSCWL